MEKKTLPVGFLGKSFSPSVQFVTAGSGGPILIRGVI